ncbi:RNase adapter RapZ [Gryllotalpicola ginsengisoli]|uniref:RNase adapter RapZ n=1 Tax=Gryllotalpicola ginsengisoli TaxID=444608 RepID=UPI0003B71EDB|nr:RNase adapter RapZ [Gryllotalpicola ginsengisoli]
MTAPEPLQDVLIVTGMSGAGRSTVAHALEDLDWFVVDNLPPQMMRPLLDLASASSGTTSRVAIVVDVRGRDFFRELQDLLPQLHDDVRLSVLFLDASDATLVRRFESVRRPHPLQGNGTILDGIMEERTRVGQLREYADLVLDTTDLNVHQLTNAVHERFASEQTPGVSVTLSSFGFKYGLPSDADMVADVRFLPNPYWQPELRPLTGQDGAVRDYVFAQDGALAFIDAYRQALSVVLAGYQHENKRHAMIAVGCTGGKHRSVAIVEELAQRLAELPGVAVNVKHRDLGRE